MLFIYEAWDDHYHDHMIWSTNRTCNNDETRAHGVAEIQQILRKQRGYSLKKKKAPRL